MGFSGDKSKGLIPSPLLSKRARYGNLPFMAVLAHILAWLPLLVLAVINGSLRQFTYAKWMSELRAHQISSCSAILIFSTFTFFLHRHWPLASANQALLIGCTWLILTVSFEFLFGHFVAKHSWQDLLQDYNLLRGRLWCLVLFALTFLPLAAFFIL